MTRRRFSEVFKRIIASEQKYVCHGMICNGRKLLPRTWQLDHIVPLFRKGTNDRINLQILCPGCHALKTQTEQMSSRN